MTREDFGAMSSTSTYAPSSAMERQNGTYTKLHPHAGARDSTGHWNYIADVTQVRRWMIQRMKATSDHREVAPLISYLPFSSDTEVAEVCAPGPREATEHFDGFNLLVNKVVVGADDPQPNATRADILASVKFRQPAGKILCAVYTIDSNHNRISAITDTWGWRCDGFFAASNKTIDDPNAIGYGSIDLPHDGEEEYMNMWQKTRSILSYMYDEYYDEYEYFYLCGDDTHLIVENLRNYLASLEETEKNETPLYLGQHFVSGVVYATGGGGYVLNKAALKEFVEQAIPTCRVNDHVPWEDVYVGKCLKELGILATDTADAAGSQRFFAWNPDFVADPDRKPEDNPLFRRLWKNGHWRVGENLASAQTISFHYLQSPITLKRHHAILYRSCPPDSHLGKELLETQV